MRFTRRAYAAAVVYFAALTPLAAVAAQYQLSWAQQFGTSYYDTFSGVTVDLAGNAYVCGYTTGSFAASNSQHQSNFVAAKYSPSGNALWTTQWSNGGGDNAYTVAMGNGGTVLVAGATNTSTSADGYLACLSQAGAIQWHAQPGTWADDRIYGVTADSNGAIYIAGHSNTNLVNGQSFPNGGSVVFKYSSAGDLQWQTEFTVYWSTTSYSIKLDNDGNTYVAGQNSKTSDWDGHLAKIDPSGNLLWQKTYGVPGSDDRFDSMAIDNAGNIYVTGNTGTSLAGPYAGGLDTYVAKLDPDGNVIWQRQLGSSADDYGASIALLPGGKIAVAGQTRGSLDGTVTGIVDVYLAILDDSGFVQQTLQLDCADNVQSVPALAVDPSGNIFLAVGTQGSLFSSNLGSSDFVLVKFAVPEPTSFALLAFGSVMLLRRRRVS